MKLKYDFIINDIAGQKVAIAVSDNVKYYSRFIKINDTGAYIMEKLKDDTTVQEIVKAIKTDFEVSADQNIEQMVNNFIEKLKEADVLEC